MATKEISRPIASVMTQVTSDLVHLVQTEFRLARAEMGETIAAASNAGVYRALDGVIALGGFTALLFDVASWITAAGLPYQWSLLIVAVIALAIGAILAVAGVNRMRASSLVPKRALEQVRLDFVAAKEQVR